MEFNSNRLSPNYMLLLFNVHFTKLIRVWTSCSGGLGGLGVREGVLFEFKPINELCCGASTLVLDDPRILLCLLFLWPSTGVRITAATAPFSLSGCVCVCACVFVSHCREIKKRTGSVPVPCQRPQLHCCSTCGAEADVGDGTKTRTFTCHGSELILYYCCV